MSDRSPTLSSNPADFVREADPGDMVVFANTSWISHLIRFGTQRPGSHVGLLCDDQGNMLSAHNEAGRDDPGAVHQDSITKVLEGTVGHSAAGSDAAYLCRPVGSWAKGAEDVVEEARRLRQLPTGFAMHDIAVLGVILISQDLDARGTDASIPGLSAPVERLVADLLRTAAEQLERRRDDPDKLVCSEFVYRCWQNIGKPLTLHDPAVKLRPAHHEVAGEPGIGWACAPMSILGQALDSGALQLTGDPVAPVRASAVPDAGRGLTAGNLTQRDLAEAVARFTNLLHAVLPAVPAPAGQMVGGETAGVPSNQAEFVAPGDFLASPSVRISAVYVKNGWPTGEDASAPAS